MPLPWTLHPLSLSVCQMWVSACCLMEVTGQGHRFTVWKESLYTADCDQRTFVGWVRVFVHCRLWSAHVGSVEVCVAVQGGFEYKRAIVDSIISIIEENSEAKEAGLAHLCEFIEDCEHTVLATRILHLLGREGPRTPQPFKYVRFIYNRVILENPAVRAGMWLMITSGSLVFVLFFCVCEV